MADTAVQEAVHKRIAQLAKEHYYVSMVEPFTHASSLTLVGYGDITMINRDRWQIGYFDDFVLIEYCKRAGDTTQHVVGSAETISYGDPELFDKVMRKFEDVYTSDANSSGNNPRRDLEEDYEASNGT